MSDILTTILARKAEELRERSTQVPLRELAARCADLPDTRGFADALHARIASGHLVCGRHSPTPAKCSKC